MTGFKDFADDVALPASDINGYLMQGILVFDSSSARDTALSGNLREGRYCYLKDSNGTYVYNGSSWVSVEGAPATVTGSTGSPSTAALGGYTTYKWTSSGTVDLTAGYLTVLVVGGGGGGNSSRSGGAGGYVSRRVYMPAGTYTITVGAAGTSTSRGGDSRFDNITAFGGGCHGDTGYPLGFGGSGAATTAPTGKNIAGQGNVGATGPGGGGGSGGAATGSTPSGVGGVGTVWDDGVTYAAGGSEAAGGAGGANTGNGGQGNSNDNGGSGIVILKIG